VDFSFDCYPLVVKLNNSLLKGVFLTPYSYHYMRKPGMLGAKHQSTPMQAATLKSPEMPASPNVLSSLLCDEEGCRF